MYVGSRRELLWTLRDRAERAEAEQELRAGKARGDERARIAREMHDVLAHRISQVSMHAGALTFRDDLTADEMRESAAVIQAQANEALHELRGVLGVLRDAETGQLLDGPQPTYGDLPALVDRPGSTGCTWSSPTALPEDAAVPATAGRTVYRIVQEGLTNAAKHAPGCTVAVRLSGTPDDGIDVLVRNPLGFAPQPHPRGRARPGRARRARRAARRPPRAPRATGRRSSCTDGYRGRHDHRRDPRAGRRRRPAGPRRRCALMLGGQPDLEVVGEAADGRAGVAAAARAAPRRGADGHPDAASSTAWRRPGRCTPSRTRRG